MEKTKVKSFTAEAQRKQRGAEQSWFGLSRRKICEKKHDFKAPRSVKDAREAS
jgi:hypothetical protein